MPRGGSKKGEHRGQLRRSLKSPTDQKVIRRGRKPKGAYTALFDPKRGVVRKVNSKHRLTVERESAMATMISGNVLANILPREVMLDGMRYYFEQWNEFRTLVQANVALAGSAKTEAAGKAFADAIAADEMQRDRYWLMAMDAARNAAPYCHARLQAVVNVGDTPDGPYEAILSILDEIEQVARSQPMITIEHKARADG